LALFIILIGVGLYIGHQYVQSQYYVGVSHGKVAVFRGLDQKIFGHSLSSVYHTTDVPLSGLPAQDAQAVRRLTSGSLGQANSLLKNVTTDYQHCQAGYAAVRHWQATKPQPKPIRKNGKIVGHTNPKIPPKPQIPPGCPPMPSNGT
jgi:PPM family protein phosphatase